MFPVLPPRALRAPAFLLLFALGACGDGGTAPQPRPELEPLIAFSHDATGGDAQVAVMKPDGSSLRSVTPGAHGDFAPSWHPSGRSLVFTSWRDELSRLYTVNVDTGGAGRLFPTGTLHAWSGAWSPDGEVVAVSTTGGIRLFDLGAGPRDLVASQDASDPAWSPSGLWVAYTALGESEEPGLRRRALFIVRRDGTGTQRLAASVHAPIHDPAWSPDGARIVFEATGLEGRGDLWVVTLATGLVTRLTETPADERHPDWSPDGSRIAFSSAAAAGADRHIFTMGASGDDRIQLTTIPGNHTSPRWRPAGGDVR
jgi:TolB protein